MAVTQRVVKDQPNIRKLTYKDFTWIDIVQPTKESESFLIEQYGFNNLDLEDALSSRQLPKIEEYPGYLFVIFHLAVFDKARRTSFRKQWSVFVGEHFLVTLRPPEFKIADEMFRDCETNEDARERLLTQGSGYLLYQILDRSIDRYFRVLDKILSLIEDIEDNVFKEEVEVAGQLANLRRDIINQRQVMFPTRTLFKQLEPRLKEFSKADLTLYFSDLMDHMDKVCNTLDEYAEVIDVFKDSDYLLSSYRANRTIRALGVLFAVTLPFVIVAAVYFMLPASKNSWGTFAILMAIVLATVTATLVALRRRHLI